MRAVIYLTLISMFGLAANTKCFGQKEDHIWLFGYTYDKAVLPNGDPDTTWGSTDINFNFDPPKIEYDPVREASFSSTNASICDQNGALLSYSNGMRIFKGVDHSILEDTIAYSALWEDRKFISNENKLVVMGYPFVDFALILPAPNDEKSYYLFYEDFDITTPSISDFSTRNLFLAKIDMVSSQVLYKDSIVVHDTLAIGGLAACRHANGRDWWVVVPSKNHDNMYTYLIDPVGIHLIGIQHFNENWPHGIGQAKFSPDGNKLCYNRGKSPIPNGTKVMIFDFDRSDGILSNKVNDYLAGGYGISRGVAYSPDSRYLYVSNDQWIYQYDLNEEDVISSRKTVATYDGYGYLYPGTLDSNFTFVTTLGFMGNGPDGRIYISAGSGGNRKMAVMHYPNEAGEACEVRQHSLHITTSYVRGMPTFPNFRLGPLDGSDCDTLGIDNNPIAKYRYEQDTIDYLKVRFTDLSYFRPEGWHWDFGDGTTSSERYPYHTFPKNGTYEVCLTVGNENSNNTVCRTLTFGTAETEETKHKELEVTLYPNPVKDFLNLTIYDYLPQKGNIHIFDSKGQKVISSRVYHGWNNVDMADLSSGSYIYQIIDEGVVIKSGKVVKVE